MYLYSLGREVNPKKGVLREDFYAPVKDQAGFRIESSFYPKVVYTLTAARCVNCAL